jgi:hypothetical protein
MCYRDGGPRARSYSPNVCSIPRFDCHHNDYFNPRPTGGNYLVTHWNLASPLNRFLQGCTYASGMLTAGAGPVDAASGDTYRDVGIPKSCVGTKFGLSGVLPPVEQLRQIDAMMARSSVAGYSLDPYVLPHIAGLPYTWETAELRLLPVPDFDVCFYAGTRLLSCSANRGDEAGTIPRTTTKARIRFVAGAEGIYVFNAV